MITVSAPRCRHSDPGLPGEESAFSLVLRPSTKKADSRREAQRKFSFKCAFKMRPKTKRWLRWLTAQLAKPTEKSALKTKDLQNLAKIKKAKTTQLEYSLSPMAADSEGLRSSPAALGHLV